MKLGVDGWRLQGARTGVRRYLINVLRHWTADATSPFSRVTCYLPRQPDRDELALPANIELRVLDSPLAMLAWDNLRLAPAVDEDILFCPSYSRPLLTRGRTVVATHDAVSQIHPELFPLSVRLFYNRLYGWSARHAALVVTNSEAARQDIAACWKVSPDRIRVVHLAPLELFRPSDDAATVDECHRRIVGSGAPFFMFAGKMSGRRNVPVLLEAFARFKRQTRHAHVLVLVGLNPQQIDIVALCRRLALSADVRLCGFVSDEDLNLLYNRTDALVMPSVYETVSLPVMEAQAAGAPVICIDTEGMREITGGAAAMIPELTASALVEAMVRVVEDPAFRSRIAAQGLENSARFCWQRCSRETLAVLAEAAAIP